MFRTRFPVLVITLLIATLAFSARAQYDGEGTQEGETPGEVTIASLGVKISQLQEQIRSLEGKIEQVSFENKQLKTQMDKSNGDIQYRLAALEKNSAAAATQAAAPAADAAPADTSQLRPVEPEGDAAAPQAATPKFASARDLYNHALGLLNHQAKYEEAGAEFETFTKRYPHDPLIGNAYYWLGDTQYARRDYLKAADSFRQGYEAMPTGPKASENLLKLAMSLDALNKDKEACVVLKKVVEKFGSSSGSAASRAKQEINRIGCN